MNTIDRNRGSHYSFRDKTERNIEVKGYDNNTQRARLSSCQASIGQVLSKVLTAKAWVFQESITGGVHMNDF